MCGGGCKRGGWRMGSGETSLETSDSSSMLTIQSYMSEKCSVFATSLCRRKSRSSVCCSRWFSNSREALFLRSSSLPVSSCSSSRLFPSS